MSKHVLKPQYKAPTASNFIWKKSIMLCKTDVLQTETDYVY